jgi:hypothetical protein
MIGSRCKAQAKSGKPCQAAPTKGGLCFFHANPNKASELGRIGGRSKRSSTAEIGDPLPVLDNAIAVRDTVARLASGVYAGKLDPRIAAGMVPLLNLQLRALETVAKFEQLAARAEANAKRDYRRTEVVPVCTEEELMQMIQEFQGEDKAAEADGSDDGL